jgi:hypothetical protein
VHEKIKKIERTKVFMSSGVPGYVIILSIIFQSRNIARLSLPNPGKYYITAFDKPRPAIIIMIYYFPLILSFTEPQ